MPLSSRIILHCPVSDETLLDGFVESCLKDRVSLIAVVGPNCAHIENMIDERVTGGGSVENRFLCTTSHPDETIEEVVDMVEHWEGGLDADVQHMRL